MNNSNRLKRWFLALAALTFVLIWIPGQVGAETGAGEITTEDIEYSEPFEVTAKIMKIDHGKKMLVIAEKEIYVVDRMVGTELIKSILSNVNGRPISFDSLASGSRVTVNGMMLPDGRVIAEELIQLN